MDNLNVNPYSPALEEKDATLVSSDKAGFFYIVQTADVADGVYKIGKTKQDNPNKRLADYPKFSCVKYTIFVENADDFEAYTIRKFKTLFKRRKEYGLEYFEGSIIDMINITHEFWQKFGTSINIEIPKDPVAIKPNGWAYFANEWLSKNLSANQPINYDEAYNAYVKILTTDFASNEYAEREVFDLYLSQLLHE
jgi:hypothetical protein